MPPRIVCGFCHAPTDDVPRCADCRHDPRLPYVQRGEEPVVIDPEPSGRPALDPAEVRQRLADARRALPAHATVDDIAEYLDVSPRTVRRWQQVSG